MQTQIVQKPLRILVVDDDSGDRKQVRRALERAELAVDCIEAESIEAALVECANREFDCAIVDYRLPGRDGLRGISALKKRLPLMPIIMATGQGDELVATEAMKRGASDYIVKTQINSESIKRSVESVLERAALRRKVIAQRTELENFAQMLVHDLSAPIASLQIFARLIEEELGLGTPNKREIIDHCRQVVSAGQRTSALLDALFEYTKAEANVTLAPVAMRRVMEDGLSNLKSVLQKRQARVSYGELPVVMGSAPQLMLLLQNLIGNAVKYCEAEPPVVRVTASLESSGTWLFAVKDNGIGIAEADRQKVFEPFKRLHNADDYQGSGLGLATCKKIVENHGGSIYCESASGEGTTFFFTLGRA